MGDTWQEGLAYLIYTIVYGYSIYCWFQIAGPLSIWLIFALVWARDVLKS
jgi:hypothetical protein